ncbi:MAG: histidinol-phosphate transaminase [Actinomycetota bacterium]
MPEPRPGLRAVPPYRAPQLDVPVRLNTNECPYALPADFVDELADAVRGIAFNRYPDRDALELREGLAAYAGVPAASVWPANGSNEVIQQLLLAYGGPGRGCVLFTPTYVLHAHLGWMTHTDVIRVETPEPWAIGEDEIRAALEASPTVVFVCSPNNPTGNTQPPEVIEQVVASTDALVIVDEAYVEFGGKSAAELVARHPNLVVVRTFSKAFALAAARIGYCIASVEVIDDLQRVRLPYHLSALSQATGVVALRHRDEAMGILDVIRTERDRLFEALRGMPGVTAYPSEANFVLFRPSRPLQEVFDGLLERGVLVRDMSAAVPGCLRVSAGTPEEGDRFLEALEGATR